MGPVWMAVAAVAGVLLGYLLTSLLSARWQSPPPRRAPLPQGEVRKSPTQPSRVLMKRGHTKDHVRNLQNLMLQKKVFFCLFFLYFSFSSLSLSLFAHWSCSVASAALHVGRGRAGEPRSGRRKLGR